MRKQFMIIVVVVIFLIVGLSGCTNEKSDSSNNDAESNEATLSLLQEKFENAMKSVALDFVDEQPSYSGGNAYNFETSQAEIDYILNYNQSQFEEHRNLIYENDDIIDELGDGYHYFTGDGRLFGYEFKNCRDYTIKGLEYLVAGEYEKAWSSFFSADNALTGANSFTGDLWPIQYGFEKGVCDILYDMGYK